MSVPLWGWLAVLAVIITMLLVDLLAHRRAHVIEVREAAIWSTVWVALGVAFGGVVWAIYGADYGAQYFAGYVIEKSLAVDNVFVFAIMFSFFAVPREYQHRVLFYGVLGALVMRTLLIGAGATLIAEFSWILYVFGAFLVVTGWRMAVSRNSHSDPGNSRLVRVIRRVVPTTDDYHGQRFWIRQGGKWVATPLFTVLVLIEVTDVIFAVDSIPAIFAVTSDPFIVFTSNIFAILGLRAMFFLLADMAERFHLLKYGLAVILMFIGVKMLLLDVYKIPVAIVLGIVGLILLVSVAASLVASRRSSPKAEDKR